MRSLALAVLVVATTVGCGGLPRPGGSPACRCDTTRDLYPSVNGDIPVCPWILAAEGCATIADYDGDGTADIDDLAVYCAERHEGDGLTMDVTAPYSSAYCYTCD